MGKKQFQQFENEDIQFESRNDEQNNIQHNLQQQNTFESPENLNQNDSLIIKENAQNSHKKENTSINQNNNNTLNSFNSGIQQQNIPNRLSESESEREQIGDQISQIIRNFNIIRNNSQNENNNNNGFQNLNSSNEENKEQEQQNQLHEQRNFEYEINQVVQDYGENIRDILKHIFQIIVHNQQNDHSENEDDRENQDTISNNQDQEEQKNQDQNTHIDQDNKSIQLQQSADDIDQNNKQENKQQKNKSFYQNSDRDRKSNELQNIQINQSNNTNQVESQQEYNKNQEEIQQQGQQLQFQINDNEDKHVIQIGSQQNEQNDSKDNSIVDKKDDDRINININQNSDNKNENANKNANENINENKNKNENEDQNKNKNDNQNKNENENVNVNIENQELYAEFNFLRNEDYKRYIEQIPIITSGIGSFCKDLLVEITMGILKFVFLLGILVDSKQNPFSQHLENNRCSNELKFVTWIMLMNGLELAMNCYLLRNIYYVYRGLKKIKHSDKTKKFLNNLYKENFNLLLNNVDKMMIFRALQSENTFFTCFMNILQNSWKLCFFLYLQTIYFTFGVDDYCSNTDERKLFLVFFYEWLYFLLAIVIVIIAVPAITITIILGIAKIIYKIFQQKKLKKLKQRQFDKLKKIKYNKKNEIFSNLEYNECIICLDNYKDNEVVLFLGCNEKHNFHFECANTWFKEHDSCPICRVKII